MAVGTAPCARAWAGSAPSLLFALIVSVGAVLTAPAPAGGAVVRADDSTVVDEGRVTAVERYLERERAELGIPGMAATLVVEEQAAMEIGLGSADRVGTPVTSETPFLIASLAKSVTAVAVMQLVEAGDVDLDRPVTTYLPQLAPGGDDVTVADLLHHRSGLSTQLGLDTLRGRSGSTLGRNAERLVDSLRPAGFTYSNANYDVLALLVQRVSGTTFEDYLQKSVFGPLGMTRSTTEPPLARRDGLATGHHHWLVLGYRPHTPPMPPGMVGSYRMFSTARDLGHFLAAHLNDGRSSAGQVLDADSLRWLHSGVPTGTEEAYGGGLSEFAVDDSAGADPLRQRRILTHEGSALGYRAVMWMLPEHDVGFVVLANGNDEADTYQLTRVAYNVQRLLLDLPVVERGPASDLVARWGKEALGVLGLIQLGLGVLLVRPLTRRLAGAPAGRTSRFAFSAATAVDVAAVVSILVAVPRVSEASLTTVMLAPDMRVLAVVMLVTALLGTVRLALWLAAGRRALHT